MKLPNLQVKPVLALVLFIIASCGGNETKKTSETTSTDSSSTSTATVSSASTTTPSSTIVTTPQAMLTVKHKVADFNKWIMAYEASDSMRDANGMHKYVVGRGLKDSTIVLVTSKADDTNKAKTYSMSSGLKQAMQKAGVVGAPTFSITTMVYQDTATINTDLRSRTTFTVKDWDTWYKGFDSTRQMRKDNGIIDRAIGHDANDNHKVIVVVALEDTTKAFAFWKSDQLKKMQAAGGVTSTPERFLYRLVRKY